uniref:Uncharacterized protein n=2 Tax=Corethron hystrix TaxID=216773 RepID=A0A7S1BJ48_9STRA|mmetsp:Transcript_28577/g.65344  ORF Transcript_28577/g.65344 Transcript_28577/m.65344 type:complete len:241 (+) Transcript_28577:211-933(+)
MKMVAERTSFHTTLANEAFVAGYSERGYASIIIGDALSRIGVKIKSVHAAGGPYQVGKVETPFMLKAVQEETLPSEYLYMFGMSSISFSSTVPNVPNYGQKEDIFSSEWREKIKAWVDEGSIAENELSHREWWFAIRKDLREVIENALENGTQNDICKNPTQVLKFLCAAIMEQDVDDIISNNSDYDLILCHGSDDELIDPKNIPEKLPDNVAIKIVPGSHSDAAYLCFLDAFQYLFFNT